MAASRLNVLREIMTNITHDIGQKLWNLCNHLRDDGVTYHQYVTELTYLLFLKMANETGDRGPAAERVPVGRSREEGSAGSA